MNKDFLCKCGHRNKMHSTLEDAKMDYNINGRICFEYKNYTDRLKGILGSWMVEEICHCYNFEPDNLKYLEKLHESRI